MSNTQIGSNRSRYSFGVNGLTCTVFFSKGLRFGKCTFPMLSDRDRPDRSGDLPPLTQSSFMNTHALTGSFLNTPERSVRLISSVTSAGRSSPDSVCAHSPCSAPHGRSRGAIPAAAARGPSASQSPYCDHAADEHSRALSHSRTEYADAAPFSGEAPFQIASRVH